MSNQEPVYPSKSLAELAEERRAQQLAQRTPSLADRNAGVLSTDLGGGAPGTAETLRERQLRTAVPQGRRGSNPNDFVRDPLQNDRLLRREQYEKLETERAQKEGRERVAPNPA